MCFTLGKTQVRQSLYTDDMQFAPEIEAGKEHDVAVDVWGLGQIILKLLASTNNNTEDQDQSPLRSLGVSMIMEAPESRPTIDAVYTYVKQLVKVL